VGSGTTPMADLQVTRSKLVGNAPQKATSFM
jgi:hypothetical protein